MKVNKKIVLYVILAAIVLFGLIQLVPFGKTYTNPPVVSEPNWDSPATRQMAKDHCFQCHSNETEWPWYSKIAPASWLIAFDVTEGRDKFNFSDWNNNPGELDEMVEAINSGEMPPIQYWIFHPSSRLNDQQKQDFVNGLKATVAQ
jgi:mono/diheme cytochrome c family protein